MDASDLDAFLLAMTDTQVMAALARRTAAKETQRKAMTAARVARFRNAKCNDDVTPKNRYSPSEGNAGVTPTVTRRCSELAAAKPPSLSPVPPIPPTQNPLNPPEPPQAAGGGDEKAKAAARKAEELRVLSLRIGAMVRRKPSTDWLLKEKRALAALYPLPEIDVAIVERYYAVPMDRDKDYRRRDVFTLLNNWAGEVDRANRHFGSTDAAPERDVGLEIITPDLFRAFLASDPDFERYSSALDEMPMRVSRLRHSIKEKFTLWFAKNRT